jgi:hypothetical protein
MEIRLDDLRSAFGFGVAGNFAGHLEQAGEAADFAGVAAASAQAPKGIFPFYVPGGDTFLGTFPLSHDRIAKPASAQPVNLQIEPEVGVVCTVGYGADGTVASAAKISHKKNWGPDSKGVARTGFAVTDLDPEGPTRSFRLASFLRRDGRTGAYGVDSALPGYSYYGRTLLDWIVDRLTHQDGSPDTPLEPVGEYLVAQAARPETVLVGIGATRYTPLGERTFLEAGDESIVVVYDATSTSPGDVEDAVRAGSERELASASVLCQTVYEGAAV